MRERATREAEPIRVAGVFEGDALLDGDGHGLCCTGRALQFEASEGSLSIPHKDVVNVRVDTDKSVTGFTLLGNLLGFVSLVMAVQFVAGVVLASVPLVSVLGLGFLFSAVLGAFGAVWLRGLEEGERRVLQVDCEDGSRTVFITQDADGAFEQIASRIAPDPTPRVRAE